MCIRDRSSLDRLVVCRVQAKRPAILYEMSDHGFQLALHHREHVRPRDEKVFEICSRKNQHFPGAIDAIEIIAVPRLCDSGPGLEIAQFLFWFLREKVVGQPKRQLSIAVQFVHNAVIVGIVLKSAARINDTGDSKAVQLAEELPRRIRLVLARQFRPLGQGRVENVCVCLLYTSRCV